LAPSLWRKSVTALAAMAPILAGVEVSDPSTL
jgi:hypothetical protein